MLDKLLQDVHEFDDPKEAIEFASNILVRNGYPLKIYKSFNAYIVVVGPAKPITYIARFITLCGLLKITESFMHIIGLL